MNIISYSFNKRDMKYMFVINYVETIKKNILNFEKYLLLTLVRYLIKNSYQVVFNYIGYYVKKSIYSCIHNYSLCLVCPLLKSKI